MGDLGYFKTEVIKQLGISKSVHARFMREHEEYSNAFEQYDTNFDAFWYRTYRQGVVMPKSVDTGLLIFAFKNIYKWRDRSEQKFSGKSVLPDKVKDLELVEKFKVKKIGGTNEKIN